MTAELDRDEFLASLKQLQAESTLADDRRRQALFAPVPTRVADPRSWTVPGIEIRYGDRVIVPGQFDKRCGHVTFAVDQIADIWWCRDHQLSVETQYGYVWHGREQFEVTDLPTGHYFIP